MRRTPCSVLAAAPAVTWALGAGLACSTSTTVVREPPPPPAWTQLAPSRLVALHRDFGTAALPALGTDAGMRPQGTLEATLPDGTRRRIQMAPTQKSAERVDDVLNGELFSAVDSDLDGRPDLLVYRGVNTVLRVEDLNRDGHFEQVSRDEMLPDAGHQTREWRDEDGDGVFDGAPAKK